MKDTKPNNHVGTTLAHPTDSPMIYSECMRVLALFISVATRPDLLDQAVKGDAQWFADHGLTPKLLAEARPVLEANREALAANAVVMERLVRHICYCAAECPGDPAMAAIIAFLLGLQQPLTGV